MSPHGDLGRYVNEFEVGRHGLELALALVVNGDLEEGVVVAPVVSLLRVYSGKLLVGGVVWRCNIMRQKNGIGDLVAQTNDITDLDTMASLARQSCGGQDLPVIVGVVVGVSSHLLALGRNTTIIVPQRVAVYVAMEIDLSLLVAKGDLVKVVDSNRLEGHHVVAQRLLELWCHEVIARSGSVEDGEVNLEPKEIEEKGNDDQADNSSSQVLAKLREGQSALATLNIHKVPKINCDRDTNGEEGEDTNILDGDDAAQIDTSQEQPLPPLSTERFVSLLIELDVGEHRERHEEDERSVEKNQTGLADVGVVQEHETGSGDASWQRVSRLPHDHEDDWDGKSTERGGHSTVCDIGDLVGDVRVANVLEQEVALVSDEPAGECEEKFAERRVDIEEVGSLEVVRCELDVELALAQVGCTQLPI